MRGIPSRRAEILQDATRLAICEHLRESALSASISRLLCALPTSKSRLTLNAPALSHALSLANTKPVLSAKSGGFGPVSDQGYGVAYMMADDDRTFFHVSSKRSCPATDSARFQRRIKGALRDLRALFESED